MLRFMYSGISGMKVNQNKLDVVGNNIANVSTTAFKSSSARFTDMLYQNAGTATAPTSNKGGTNAKQVGLGAKLSSINRVMSQGNALSTGRSLDVCIDGEGYFMAGVGPNDYTTSSTKIKSDMSVDGGNMQITYTRDGNFTLDKDGNLLTADGRRVLGYLLKSYDKDGKEFGANSSINLATDTVTDDSVSPKLAIGDVMFVDADGTLKAVGDDDSGDPTNLELQPLKIPDKVYVPAISGDSNSKSSWQKVASFAIGKDGVITAVLANGKKTALGQIATATFTNPEGLTAIGGNYFEVSPNSGAELIRTSVNIDKKKTGEVRTDKLVDNSKAFGDSVQGCLEASNVDLTEQFTDMISATRSFQASSKLITTGDEILQTITGLLR